MKMKKYCLDEKYQEIYNSLSERGGKITPKINAEINNLYDNLENKLENFALMYKNIACDEDVLKQKYESIIVQKKSLETCKEMLRQVLDELMTADNRTKYRTPHVDLSYRKSTSLQINDFEALPDNFKMQSFETKAKRTEIILGLKNGDQIPGATLCQAQNLQIK